MRKGEDTHKTTWVLNLIGSIKLSKYHLVKQPTLSWLTSFYSLLVSYTFRDQRKPLLFYPSTIFIVSLFKDSPCQNILTPTRMWWTVRLHLWSSPSHRWGAAGNSFWWHSRIVVVAFSNQPLSVHPSVHLAPCLCPSVTLCPTPLSSEHLDCETTWIVRLSEHLDYHIPPQVATQCHPPWLGIAAGWRGARHSTTTDHKPIHSLLISPAT